MGALLSHCGPGSWDRGADYRASFAVVATAGLGRIEGAALTALLMGLGRSITVYFEPELEVVVPYLIMVMVLLIRPQGLFGVVETRRV